MCLNIGARELVYTRREPLYECNILYRIYNRFGSPVRFDTLIRVYLDRAGKRRVHQDFVIIRDWRDVIINKIILLL